MSNCARRNTWQAFHDRHRWAYNFNRARQTKRGASLAYDFTRRHFFFGPLLAGAVPLAGFGTVPSLKAMGYKSPNEKLNIASIGAGGKAASDIRGCAQTENIVALCDVDQRRAEPIFTQFDKAQKYKDFRVMLD